MLKDAETLLYVSRMVLTLKYMNVKLQNPAVSVLPVVNHYRNVYLVGAVNQAIIVAVLKVERLLVAKTV